MWDIITRPNLRLEEQRKEKKPKSKAKKICSKNHRRNFPNLKKKMTIKVQETYRIQNRMY